MIQFCSNLRVLFFLQAYIHQMAVPSPRQIWMDSDTSNTCDEYKENSSSNTKKWGNGLNYHKI